MPKKILLQKRNGRLIPVINTDPAPFPGEEWKDIPHHDYYQVSNYGRIRSLDRYVDNPRGRGWFRKGKIISLTIKPGKHANQVQGMITLNKVQHSVAVGRLVYKLFVAPDFDYNDRFSIIARKDGNPLNYHYKNLELISVSENLSNGYAAGKRILPGAMPVHQYDATGKYVKTFPSRDSAAREIGVVSASVQTAIELPNLRCNGCYWRQGKKEKKIDVSGYNEKRKERLGQTKKQVLKIASTGKVMQAFESVSAAVRAIGGTILQMRKACNKPDKKYKGFFWKYGKKKSNPVHQYDMDGVFIKSHDSPHAAAQSAGACPETIRQAAKQNGKSLRGFFWRYGEPQLQITVTPDMKRLRGKYVQQLTQEGTPVSSYPSLSAAARALEFNYKMISRACREPDTLYNGFRWQFA